MYNKLFQIKRALSNPEMRVIENPKVYDALGNPIEGAIVTAPDIGNPYDGLELLGSGSFGHVYALNDRLVLKVVKNGDKAYQRFVELARANQHNPHFPRIYMAKKWGPHWVYLLERLSSTHHVNRDYLASLIQVTMVNPYVTINDPHIEECVRLLKENDLTNDCYGRNLMMRGECPVVTDPACGD